MAQPPDRRNDETDQPFFKYSRRWYDEIGNMAMAIHMSRKLPGEIQQIIAHNLNEAIDHQRALRQKDRITYSVGVNRALGLYKASKRQRWYDPHVKLHRAFSLMSSMPTELLADYAERIMDVNEFVHGKTAKGRLVDPYVLAETVEDLMRRAIPLPAAETPIASEGMATPQIQNQYQIPGHHVIIHHTQPRRGQDR